MNDRLGPDDGVTLVELVVAMTIMTVFMTIFTTGIVQMFDAMDRTEATSTVQSQLDVAFLRVDRQLRYAAGITAPGSVNANGYVDTYVEYLTGTDTDGMCGQLRLRVPATGPAVGQLQIRSWPVSQQPGAVWATLASGVSAATPFTLHPPDTASNFERLELSLTATSGAGTRAASRTTDITFTALNSQPGGNPAPGQATHDPTACATWRSG